MLWLLKLSVYVPGVNNLVQPELFCQATQVRMHLIIPLKRQQLRP